MSSLLDGYEDDDTVDRSPTDIKGIVAKTLPAVSKTRTTSTAARQPLAKVNH
jgi:hypothetical protein